METFLREANPFIKGFDSYLVLYYWVLALPVPADKPFHAHQGFLDVSQRGCITAPNVTFSALSEGRTRNNRYLLLGQQFLGEVF